MVTTEEARKFLNLGVVRQTIVGQSAREMRRHHVTLILIDQPLPGVEGGIMS